MMTTWTHRWFPAACGALVIACAAGESQALTARQLDGLLKRREPVIVIDVRSPRDFAVAHIPGALNIPKELLAGKRLPPLGRVVVCGDGISTLDAADAAQVLSAKPGIGAEVLEGGMPAWQTLGLSDTRAAGVEIERLRYLTYEDLKAVGHDPEVTLVDLREGATVPLTELAAAFPALDRLRVGKRGGDAAVRSLVAGGRRGERFLVLIDDGDGRAEALARRLRAAGVARLAILAGGERSLAVGGRPGRRTQETSGEAR